MEHKFNDFQNAIARLGEMLAEEKSEAVRDSAIKRFEICFELAWKVIKAYAQKDAVECYSPRECFKTGFQIGLIDYDERWLKMIDDRNTTTHIYRLEYAEEIYDRLDDYLELFGQLAKRIVQKTD